MNKIYFSFFFLFSLVGHCDEPVGSFNFTLTTKEIIQVHFFRPNLINEKTRLVMVMHGRQRNGEEYRNQWVEKGKELNLVIIVPEFTEEKFPGVFGFNYGNVLTESLHPTQNSIFDEIEALVNTAILRFGIQSNNWGIYGHGAGAHFVHRLVLHNPEINFKLAIAANPGWYLTLTDKEWPFGLKDSGITDDELKLSLAKYFLLMLGRSDTSTEPNTPYVASIFDKVSAQGQHRLDRGRNFFVGSIEKAKELDVFFKWGMVEVPTKDGHSNTQQMVPYAAELFYERLR